MKNKKIYENISQDSLERSDKEIRSRKNRIARSDAHHKRKAIKKEKRKMVRLQKREIIQKTGVAAYQPAIKDMEKFHHEDICASTVQTIEGEADWSTPQDMSRKVLLTTCIKPAKAVNLFLKDLKCLFPKCKLYKRRQYNLVDICTYARGSGFSHVLAVTQSHGKVVGMTVTFLSNGLTAHFRLSNLKLCKDIPNRAEWTKHYPELFFKGFDTSIANTTKKIIESVFPTKRDYRGRAVVTFLNKRDFIFVRAHRYMFDSSEDVNMQELGPRFTLRLNKITRRNFDSQDLASKINDIAWYRPKRTSKREFAL